nr:MAG TPA: hypothetical protein [Caudoviricetes sp.]
MSSRKPLFPFDLANIRQITIGCISFCANKP